MQIAQFQLHANIEQRHWWFVARRQILASVIEAVLPPLESTTIVDVGCGTGGNLSRLAEQYECVGIDTSADAIRLAKERFPKITFIQGRAAPDALGDVMARARLVILADVLEHVEDDFYMFSELLAASQPETYFLITVPANLSLWSAHDQAFGHYRRYDRERLEQLWGGLSASSLFVTHFNSRLYPLVKWARDRNRRRGQASGEAGTDFRLPSAMNNFLLTRVFAGERHRLVRMARGEAAPAYAHGVSLMALVKRSAGEIVPRRKPSYAASDFYDPTAPELAAASV